MNVCGRAGLRAAALLMAVMLLAPSPASAQDYDTSVAWGGGLIQFAPWVDAGGASPRDLGLGSGMTAVLHGETWHFNRWVGARLGGFYSRGTVEYPTANKNANAWGAEASGLVRVMPPAAERMVTAYLIGGGGLTWFTLGEGPHVAPIAGTSTVIYSPDWRRLWTAHGGAGVEIMSGMRAFDGQLGVRIEAANMVTFNAPLRVEGATSPDPAHNLRVFVTLFSGVPRLF